MDGYRLSRAAIRSACTLVSLVMVSASVVANEPMTELAAGGLVFAAQETLVVDREDVTIAPDKVTVTYVLRNKDNRDRKILFVFSLPDIDLAGLNGASVAIPAYSRQNPTNFVGFWTLVDGQPAKAAVDQRALALGVVDQTEWLTSLGLPLYPFAPELVDKLNALPPATRANLLEQSVVTQNQDTLEPYWTLRTTFHWRQEIPKDKTVTVQHGYRPVTGSLQWTEENSDSLAKRYCVPQALAADLDQRAKAGQPATVWLVHYLANIGAYLKGPVGKYRLMVEAGGAKAAAATCRTGTKAAASGALEWTASEYISDDEFQVLFVE